MFDSDLFKHYSDAVGRYADSTIGIPDAWVGHCDWLHVSVSDFVSGVFTAAFLRSVVHYKVHWFRLLAVHWILSVGGSTIVGLLVGSVPRWFSDPAVANALLLSYLAIFHLPGDFVYKLYSVKALRPLWDVLKALGAALGISVYGVDRLPGVREWRTWPTRFIAGVLCGCGGSTAAELLNLLLLSKQQYQVPKRGAPSSVVTALLLITTYLALYDGKYLSKEHAAAVLVVVSVVLAMIPDVSAVFHRLLDVIPGWKSTLVPTNLAESTTVSPTGALRISEIFGYEPIVDEEREVFLEADDAWDLFLDESDSEDEDYSPSEESESEEEEEDEEEDSESGDGASSSGAEDADVEATPARTPAKGATKKKSATPAAASARKTSAKKKAPSPSPARSAAKSAKKDAPQAATPPAAAKKRGRQTKQTNAAAADSKKAPTPKQTRARAAKK